MIHHERSAILGIFRASVASMQLQEKQFYAICWGKKAHFIKNICVIYLGCIYDLAVRTMKILYHHL